MRKAIIEAKDFLLTFDGPKGRERLGIRSEYLESQIARQLFQGLGIMHLVAPYLPRVIETNAAIRWEIRRLIGSMYRSERRKSPKIIAPRAKATPWYYQAPTRRAVVAGSAGKDTLWNIWRAETEFGDNNVLVAHVSGLNRNNAAREREYTLRQHDKLNFRRAPRILDLLNSSQNTGYAVMRSRDMFLTGLLVPIALEFGASEILTEGFSEEKPTEPFSGKEANMIRFNRIIQNLGLPVRVSWKNQPEMEIIRDLFEYRPWWMPEVCNCFTVPCYQPNCRRAWKKHAPTLQLYDSQCGSCVKCRIVNLARILYDTNLHASKQDIQFFLANTDAWIRKNRERLSDMIEGSFLRDFNKAVAQYC